jgi:hypothetical protein
MKEAASRGSATERACGEEAVDGVVERKVDRGG